MRACDDFEKSLSQEPSGESEQNQWFRDFCTLLRSDSLKSFAIGSLPTEDERRESFYDAKA
jgi:hypothetical protein